MRMTVGLDIGGTKILGALVDADGVIIERSRRDTPSADPSGIVDAAAALALDLARDRDVAAVGAACAGFIDRDRERVLFAPNIVWRGEPLRAQLEERIGLPVVIENDANAAAWGEFCHGSAADVDSMLLLTIGTGVGGGIVSDGRLLYGAFGIGAEVGHMRMVPDGLPCGCGLRGCLEAYGSGSALLRAARELVTSGAPEAAALVEACGGDPEALTGREIDQAAAAGDAAALGLLADLGRWIGEGAASLSAVLDPEAVLIGGGVSRAGDLLLDPIRTAYAQSITGGDHRPQASIRFARLLDDAGMIGAAALARDVAATER